jgi:C-terminal processing protease CtpA/Prc
VIRSRGVRTLAVDIRNNGGGSSQLGDALLDYIAYSPYKQVDRMEAKSSKEMKKYFRQRYLRWYFYPLVPFSVFSRQARHYIFGRPGTIQVITDRRPQKPGSPRFKFDGEVFLLVSNYTFSSANMLANAIACYDLGTLVGEETGGVLRAFGDIIPIQLPNTGLSAGCSFKRFLHPCDDGRVHGVMPDVQIIPTAEDILHGRDRALEYVKAKAAGRMK